MRTVLGRSCNLRGSIKWASASDIRKLSKSIRPKAAVGSTFAAPAAPETVEAEAAYNKWAMDKDSATNGLTPNRVSDERSHVFINSHFDSGNIEIVNATDPSDIQLAIHADPYCETDKRAHFMWFNFRMTGVRQLPLTLNITNAGQASFPAAWEGYQTVASYDLVRWFRVPTKYNSSSGVLSIQHTPERDAVQYAYFAPYTYGRHCSLVHRMQAKDNVRLHMLGETLDGHDMDCLQIGTPGTGKPVIWIIARQHPGESMAEWFVEGLLERLTDPADATARTLLQKAVFYVVPNMCPDGAWRGHLRTNAAGTNLNRAWAAPTVEESPEVLHTLTKIQETGCDAFFDIHGDEELPHLFIAGNNGIPKWGPRLEDLQTCFCEAFKRSSPEFQTEFGYAQDKPGKANMTLASKSVGERFDCLSVTLEMPFKDTTNLPEPVHGWSPERSISLGASMLGAILEVLPKLRA